MPKIKWPNKDSHLLLVACNFAFETASVNGLLSVTTVNFAP